MSGYRESLGISAIVHRLRENKSVRLQKIIGVEEDKDPLRLVGNPHNGLKFIHVAGSKGKGSTCAFVAYILREAGFP